ncbi:MAG: hypothetical protein H7A23_24815 [Leptospiraceae bacterium]|nr:hypothetical protein [Leptospiraceae bacterium]
MEVYIWIVAGIVFLCIFPVLAELKGITSHLIVYFFLPSILLTYHYMSSGEIGSGTFGIIKVFSVCFAVLLLAGIRYKNLIKSNLIRIIVYLTLFVNILEAVGFEIYDALASGPERLYGGSLINATAGITLLLSQAYPRFLSVDEKNNLHYDLGTPWILSYVLWNFTFVYGTNPPGEPTGQYAAFALIHLIAPILLMRGKVSLFMQYRSYTLAPAMTVFVLTTESPWFYKVPSWYSLNVAEFLGWLSLASACYVLFKIWQNRRNEQRINILDSIIKLILKV